MRGSRGGIGGLDPPPEHLKLNVFLYKKEIGPPPPPWKNGTPSESLEKHINKLRTHKRNQGCFLSVGTGFRGGPIFPGEGGGGGGGGVVVVQMLISTETHAT